MSERKYLDAVPAYLATATDGRTAPFIVSLLMYDAAKKLRLTSAVEASINRTVDLTGREGLATAIIADNDPFPSTVIRYMERAMSFGAIVLFSCQSPGTAERLMQHLDANYRLTLIREG